MNRRRLFSMTATLVIIILAVIRWPDWLTRRHEQDVVFTDIDSMVIHLDKLLDSKDYANFARVLELADYESMSANEYKSHPLSLRYLVVAEDTLLTPGLPFDKENQVVTLRQFVGIPGLTDVSPIPRTYHDRVFLGARELAFNYNTALFHLQQNSPASQH